MMSACIVAELVTIKTTGGWQINVTHIHSPAGSSIQIENIGPDGRPHFVRIPRQYVERVRNALNSFLEQSQ